MDERDERGTGPRLLRPHELVEEVGRFHADRQRLDALMGYPDSDPGLDQRPLTFDRLCEADPALRDLEREARSIGAADLPDDFCANDAWYGYGRYRGKGIKPRLKDLVGWDALVPALRTEDAYDLAYDTLYNLLPSCRNCGCM